MNFPRFRWSPDIRWEAWRPFFEREFDGWRAKLSGSGGSGPVVETDPVWTADKPNYATTIYVNAACAAVLIHPTHPATRITFDPDGGMTLITDIRVTIKNTASGDEVTY